MPVRLTQQFERVLYPLPNNIKISLKKLIIIINLDENISSDRNFINLFLCLVLFRILV